MKIGIVCYPTYGGSGIMATELGIALAENGHEVHFITYSRPARLTSFCQNVFFHEVTEADYPLFEFQPYDTALSSKLIDVCRYEKLDILHVHYAIPHAAVAFMTREILKTKGINIPFVTTLHGTDITLVGVNKSFLPVVEFSINQSDGVTAVSQSLKDQTLENFEIKKDIKVIPNFIDFKRFHKTNKSHFKKAIAPDGEKILVHVSNFRKVKHVEDVVHIFKKVNDVVPSKLLLIGDGPERPAVEELCRQYKLCHEIRFLGKQDAIEEILAISDLFIMPSEKESFGLAALEAMACEVPVISTNIGGIPDVNKHGVTGFLSNVGDIEDMANNALKLLTNEELLRQFRANAFTQAENFDLVKVLPTYENYYRTIIAESKVKI